jgi:hypothetical protein
MDQLELSLGQPTELSNQNEVDDEPTKFLVDAVRNFNERFPSKKTGVGLRYDTGKNRLDLIPPEWEWELGRVLTAGANKYADRNWELGMDWSKIVGPLRRHLNCFLRGERLDKETGCHHLGHVAWNALALLSYDLRGIGTDNLARKDCVK